MPPTLPEVWQLGRLELHWANTNAVIYPLADYRGAELLGLAQAQPGCSMCT